MGYRRGDQPTWKSTNIPRHRHGGLFDQYVWVELVEAFVLMGFQLLFCSRTIRLGLQIGTRSQGYFCQDLGYRQAHGLLRYENRLALYILSLIVTDGGTLAFPTPEEANHGKAPWPHVRAKSFCFEDIVDANNVIVWSERLPSLASLHSGSTQPRMSLNALSMSTITPSQSLTDCVATQWPRRRWARSPERICAPL